MRHLPIQLSIFAKGKQYKGFLETTNEFKQRLQLEPNNKQLQCLSHLFQLAFYFHINNQKQYTQSFIEFIKSFFIPQLETSEEQRFLRPQVFNQFAQNVVFYIQRNAQILNGFQDQVIKFVDFIQDPKAVAKIAEGFVDKKNYVQAEAIFKVLVKRHPSNMLFQSRLNFIYSVLSPENINENILPQFETVNDFNSLNNLESDYLKYLMENKGKTTEGEKKTEIQEKQKKIKKKKKKILWPKNFNFENPGPRPDAERWLPKHMKTKFKKGKKKGMQTRTQGGMAQANKNFDLFVQEHSTAQQTT